MDDKTVRQYNHWNKMTGPGWTLEAHERPLTVFLIETNVLTVAVGKDGHTAFPRAIACYPVSDSVDQPHPGLECVRAYVGMVVVTSLAEKEQPCQFGVALVARHYNREGFVFKILCFRIFSWPFGGFKLQ